MKQFKEIELSKIRSPQVRDRIDIDPVYIESLAADIQENGLINPILVRPQGDFFEIVAGECRFLAVRSLGSKKVTCHVQELDDGDAAILRAVENLDREGLTPIEEALIYQRLVDTHNMTLDQVSKRVKKSVGVVKRRMDLLRMPQMLQSAIQIGKINCGVAEELWRFGDEGTISYYLGFCVEHGATVAVVRQWVSDYEKSKRSGAADVDGSGGLPNPMEMAPSYISCNVCNGPVVLGKEIVIRVCGRCFEQIKQALREG